MANQPQQLEYKTIHANSWPPHDAVPGTAPFTVKGTVLKTYPLRILPKPVVEQSEVVKGMKAPEYDPVDYIAIEIKAETYIRNPAEGEISDIRPSNEEDFFHNIGAALEFLLGRPCDLPKREVPHVWTGQDTFVFWALPKSVDEHTDGPFAVGDAITIQTNCSTVTVKTFGEDVSAGKGRGLKIDKKFLPKKKAESSDDEDWE